MEINKIYQGDCLEIIKQFPDKSIDLIQADPPYNFDASSGRGFIAKTKKQYIKNIKESFGMDFQPEEYLEASVRVMKVYNAYWWCSKNLVHRYINWAVSQKFSFNILTWHKENPVPLWHGNYLPDTEYCIFMREKGAFFNSKLGNFEKYRKYYITNIGGNNQAKYHPPQKPKWIIKNQIEVSSLPAGIVLDMFSGSGTTAVACVDLDRRYICIEINPGYCQIAEDRLKQRIL